MSPSIQSVNMEMDGQLLLVHSINIVFPETSPLANLEQISTYFQSLGGGGDGDH